MGKIWCMYTPMKLSPQSRSRTKPSPLKVFSCSFVVPPSGSLPTPNHHWSASCHNNLHFLELYIKGIMWYILSFCPFLSPNIHPCCCLYQQFIALCCWVVLYCMHVSRLDGYVDCFGHYEQCYYEHSCISLCVDMCFHISRCYIDNLALATRVVFAPQKLANITNPRLFPRDLVVKYLPPYQ